MSEQTTLYYSQPFTPLFHRRRSSMKRHKNTTRSLYANLSLFLLLSLNATSAQTKELHFLAANYCPLVCTSTEENGKEGIMIDVVRHIYKAPKYRIKISFVPVARLLKIMNNNPSEKSQYAGVIGGNQHNFPMPCFLNTGFLKLYPF
jgi:hypothetical protein